MDMTISWWLLVTLGVVLVIAEVFIGAFVVLWFGVGAIAAGLLTLAVPDLNAGIQLLITALIGAVLLYFFRDRCVAGNNASAEELHTFSSTTGELRVSDQGAVTVFANGTFWQVANPEVLDEAHRVNGARVQIAEFRNNRAWLAGAPAGG